MQPRHSTSNIFLFQSTSADERPPHSISSMRFQTKARLFPTIPPCYTRPLKPQAGRHRKEHPETAVLAEVVGNDLEGIEICKFAPYYYADNKSYTY
eukprot:2188769-Rhodomonas_salina.1